MLGAITSHSLFANELDFDFINDVPSLRTSKFASMTNATPKAGATHCADVAQIWARRETRHSIAGPPSSLTVLDLSHQAVLTRP